MRKYKTKDGYVLSWYRKPTKGTYTMSWDVQVFKELPGYSAPQYVSSYTKHKDFKNEKRN